MTTIVYRDGVLAADQRMTQGDTLVSDKCKKLVRMSDGSLVAIAGRLSLAQKFVEWARKGGKGSPPTGAVYDGIWLRHDGLYVWESGDHVIKLDQRRFYAWGSGQIAALGALHYGASATEAVRCAAKVDISTGGKIVSAKLKKRDSNA
jgi:ATP-dependent protease HslVU (ClpYQ) peptidase subunit